MEMFFNKNCTVFGHNQLNIERMIKTLKLQHRDCILLFYFFLTNRPTCVLFGLKKSYMNIMDLSIYKYI